MWYPVVRILLILVNGQNSWPLDGLRVSQKQSCRQSKTFLDAHSPRLVGNFSRQNHITTQLYVGYAADIPQYYIGV